MNRGIGNNRRHLSNGGPSIKVPVLWSVGWDPPGLLDEEDRAMLAAIATVGRYKKGELIYQEGTSADYVFNIISGVAKSYRSQENHRPQVVALLFPHDVIGLAADGKYVNSAAAVTQVTLYKMPAAALEARLRRNPRLDFQVICKLCNDLREAQQHALLLSRHRAAAKLCLFLQMLETHQNAEGHLSNEIQVPMARADVAAYVNMSPEAVTRSLRQLVRRGVISVRDRRYIKIIDRSGLEDIISETAKASKPVPQMG
jgi:CRP-like cAMP-binding protein